MKALTLAEFAEELRRKGDWREADFGAEILELLVLEDEVAEPYSDIRGDIENYAKGFSNPDDAPKALEWIGDRSNLLEEIERQLKEAGRTGDADDAVKELLGTFADAEKILEDHGWPGTDFLDALENLAESAPTPKEYDL